MSPENQQALFDKYPEIFRERTLSPQETCMCWGLECNSGWYDLIDVLCEALTYTYSTGLMVDGKGVSVEPPKVIALQCKEKFSTLRFYYRLEFAEDFIKLCETNEEARKIAARYTAYFDGIVHMAEILSGRTCEVTGARGEICVRNGWYKTLCPEKAKELGYMTPKEWKELREKASVVLEDDGKEVNTEECP